MRLRIPDSAVNQLAVRLSPKLSALEALGAYGVQQVKSRHLTQGASGGKPWPPKAMKAMGYDDGRAILTGKSGDMLDRWFSYASLDGAHGTVVVANSAPQSNVLEQGTVGKGGTLPTIRPRNAKALWIPITDRAIEFGEAMKFRAARMSTAGGRARLYMPEQFPGGPTKGGILGGAELIKGRIKNGRLQKWDANSGEYVDGVPDFIFLKKSDIAPRPQLPTSDSERSDQAAFLMGNGQSPQ